MLISNDSRRAIQRETFRQPITITARAGRVVAAVPCPPTQNFRGNFIGQWNVDAPATPRLDGATVTVDIELLNKGETACVIVVSTDVSTEQKASERLAISARLIETDFVLFSSLDQLLSPRYQSLLDFFYVNIHLVGLSVYLFVSLQILLFALAALLAIRARSLTGSVFAQVSKLTFLAVLSTAAAQVLVALKDLGLQLHVASWPTLAVYVATILFLAWRAWALNSSANPRDA